MPGPDRRKTRRFRIDCPATLVIRDRWVLARALDLGLGGMRLAVNEALDPPRDARLRFTHRGNECTAHGTVAWADARAIGVVFSEVNEAFRRLISDFETLSESFHRRLVEQLAELEVELGAR